MAIKKKGMKEALGSTLRAEERAVQSRFAKADAAMGLRNERPKAADKVIRDSFSIPAADYELIAVIRTRCLSAGIYKNKSEVVRAGLHILNTLADRDLQAALAAVEAVRTGRPVTR
jgi:hypothetical protein